MAQQIPLHTLLGDRYKVTAHVLETADGDTILDGVDQILNRKVSIVVASAEHSSQLVANARQSASLYRSSVQILDLGNVEARTYLVTSHARPDTLLTTLLTEGGGETEEFGEEIFGDTGTMSAPNTYVVAKDVKAPAAGAGAAAAATSSISATRAAAEPEVEPVEEYEEYDAEEDGYYEGDEPAERNGGMWAVGIAAVLVLVIGAGAVFTSLGNMVNPTETQDALGSTQTSASASETPQQTGSPSPSPSATEEKEPAAPRLDGNFTRTVPSSAALMAESDGTLGHLTDGNDASTWVSLAFGSANFGGLTDSFYLSAPLRDETTVNSLTINQVSGTGGAFNVFASNDASIEGAQQIGSGTFAATGETTVELDKDAQDGDTKYIIVQFTEAPRLAQPIVQGYPFGLRLAEISVK